MKAKIIEVGQDYIKFELVNLRNKVRTSKITRKVLEYHKIPSFYVGQEIEVLRTFRNDKEFYKIIKILTY